MKRIFWLLCAVLLLPTGCFLATNSRAGTETAACRVLEKEGAFELREYDALHLASVTMPAEGGRSGAMDGGFMKLFRYITGANATGEKIAMTTPVIVRGEGAAASMSFVMPKDGVQRGLPTPQGAVRLEQLPAARVAVVRFPGVSNPEKERVQGENLRAWAAKRGLKLEGEPLRAYYDPPWTPGVLRRNEVMWRVR